MRAVMFPCYHDVTGRDSAPGFNRSLPQWNTNTMSMRSSDPIGMQSHDTARAQQENRDHEDGEPAASDSPRAKLNRARSQLLRVAAHELRAPLTAVGGYIEMLLDEEFGPLSIDQREPLEIASDGVEQIQTITNDLIDATRIDMGHIELTLAPTDLPALVAAVGADLLPHLQARAQSLSLHTVDDLPPAHCDEVRTRQIVRSLLYDTCRHTPHGEQIDVTVSHAGEGGFLQIAISVPAGPPRLTHHALHSKSIGPAAVGEDSLEIHIARSLVHLHNGQLGLRYEPDGRRVLCATVPIASELSTA